MKTVFLIGDSVRNGYDRYVRESLAGVAEVCYPAENCRFAAYILRYAHMWKSALNIENADVVHWNAGLWDTLRIYGDGPLTPPDVYGDYIGRIDDRLAFLFPGAVRIFATSTPVIESGYIKEFEYRTNADVERYNAIAKRVLAPRGVRINDLYALLKDRPDALHSDQTHYFTADATELIGTQVVKVICEAAGIDQRAVKAPDKNGFVVTAYKNDNEMYVRKGHLYEPV